MSVAFDPTNVGVTHDALRLLTDNEMPVEHLLSRYTRGDWGQVSLAEATRNDAAVLSRKGRAVGRYPLPDGNIVVLVTLWNQPLTSIISATEMEQAVGEDTPEPDSPVA